MCEAEKLRLLKQ